MCVTTYCVHSQDDEGPVIINAVINPVSDAVKRHPNLVEVTLGICCSGPLALGVLKGVLQKEDVRKVDVMEGWYTAPRSKPADVVISECECLCVCVVSAVCSHVHCVSTCIQLPWRTLSKSTSYLQ